MDARHHQSIRCQISVAPQLGESLDLGLVSEAIGGSCHIDHLASKYTEGLITIYARLKHRILWQLRVRSRFEGKLLFAIEREMGGYEMAGYLRKLYGSSPAVPTPGRDAPRRKWNQEFDGLAKNHGCIQD
jgi:hypothetical protein